ncbi:MAG: 4-hydroxybenzoyl-CoA thioesterase [Gemmatimonadetes bacterium]|nr:4-hydroxybenzoyl-CoA thioesterase [Gemmatimonadota bacterium]
MPAQRVEFRVRYAETDQMGVVYHANYLVWCEIGRTEYIRTFGVSYAELERGGLGLAVSEATARFHGAARYDELIAVTTTITTIRSRAVTFDYLITRASDDTRLVSAQTVLVSLDSAGRPRALPTDFRALLESTVAG